MDGHGKLHTANVSDQARSLDQATTVEVDLRARHANLIEATEIRPAVRWSVLSAPIQAALGSLAQRNHCIAGGRGAALREDALITASIRALAVNGFSR